VTLLRRRLFPGWLGPIIGIPAGLAFGYQVWTETQDDSLPFFLAIGGAMGALAGCLVWFSDWLTIRSGLRRYQRQIRGEVPPLSRGVFWPALAWVCCLIPIVGLVVSIVAYRKTQGSYPVFFTFVPAGASAILGAFWLLNQFT